MCEKLAKEYGVLENIGIIEEKCWNLGEGTRGLKRKVERS